MGRLFRRKRVVEEPADDGFWQVPARFNYTRDVVEAQAVDRVNPALTFVDRQGVVDRRTFLELANEANRWSALLRARGLSPGDRLLVFVGRTPTWHAILLGALKAGLVSVLCSETLRARDLELRATQSGARLIVSDRKHASRVAMMDVPLEVVLAEDADSELRGFAVPQPTHDTAAEDVAFILYASGETKDPRGIVHTHASTWAQRIPAEHWLEARPGDLVWCTAEPGWPEPTANVLLGPWSCGAEIVIHDRRFDAEERLALLQRLGVTVLCQTSTEYGLMTDLPSFTQFDLRRLRHAVSVGEPLDRDVADAFHDAFGIAVCEGYGQPESTILVANVRGTEIKPGSIGLPTPGHDMAVIDDRRYRAACGHRR